MEYSYRLHLLIILFCFIIVLHNSLFLIYLIHIFTLLKFPLPISRNDADDLTILILLVLLCFVYLFLFYFALPIQCNNFGEISWTLIMGFLYNSNSCNSSDLLNLTIAPIRGIWIHIICIFRMSEHHIVVPINYGWSQFCKLELNKTEVGKVSMIQHNIVNFGAHRGHKKWIH
jgi:hypothetical protein